MYTDKKFQNALIFRKSRPEGLEVRSTCAFAHNRNRFFKTLVLMTRSPFDMCFCTDTETGSIELNRALKDSNPRHPVLETDVLPTELRTQLKIFNFQPVQLVEQFELPQTRRFAGQLNKNFILFPCA